MWAPLGYAKMTVGEGSSEFKQVEDMVIPNQWWDRKKTTEWAGSERVIRSWLDDQTGVFFSSVAERRQTERPFVTQFPSRQRG